MADITKHPHYVYRYYLRAWAPDEQIYCLRERKKLFPTNLMNIGQESGFYEFKICTDEEITVGYHYAENGFENIMHMYKWVNYELKIASVQSDEQRNNELLDFAKQFEETHFNCKVENRLKKVLPLLYKKDFSFFYDETIAMEFFHAIAEQYCRTKKMKEGTINAVSALENPNIRGENVWLLIRHSIAAKIGLFLFSEKYQVCLLESADGYFITSDQPIVNIHAGYGNVIPDNFELYYPIAPHLSLMISKQEKYPDKTIVSVNEVEAMSWNNRIVNLSYNQLFSDKKTILENYKIANS